jgi:galactokinase/mevalonate kinase-like predicted kinase
MRYILTIPARINILGNPGDANEGDFATISSAINLRAGAFIEPSDHIILESISTEYRDGNYHKTDSNKRLDFTAQEIPLIYDNELDLLKAALNQFYNYSQQLRERITTRGVHIAIWSDIPRQSGLGGSSLLVLLVLAGLREWYQLNPYLYNDYILAELTQRTEENEFGITCGFADRYVPLFGGLAYLDYRGKLHHKEIRQEPLATYERLDHYIDDIPILAVSTGIKHDSGDVHGQMRPRYLIEYNDWQRKGGKKPPMVVFMSEAWNTAWRGKIALLEKDWATFGKLMNKNHQIVNQMMTYCGFSEGAGWANNLFIDSALENHAFGAKLTGAGGGGSVFALVRPGKERMVEGGWQKIIAKYDLSEANIFLPQISKQGLIIQLDE